MSHAKRDTDAPTTNAYVEVLDYGGPPNAHGRIEVQIAVWADKEMSEQLLEVYECYSVGSMNRAMSEIMNKYRGDDE
jgi:hypothetical protein